MEEYMLLGIDVGGTHTDAVLVGDEGVLKSFKTRTDRGNLLGSVTAALAEVTSGFDVKKITNINLSTTLSTNAIVEQKLEKTGLFISSGPGINPENFLMGDCTFVIPGSIDHRGTETQKLDMKTVAKGLSECKAKGVRVYAAVSKFSTRNKDHEEQMKSAAEGQSDFITQGYRLSSQLSFPRRVATAYYNSAVWRIYNNFTDAVMKTVSQSGINAPVNILKADGGTMPVQVSRETPVESILSGPAASIMGIIALCNIEHDSVILDIGGTTTDIAIFASGAPLIEREGIRLGGSPTLVRSLQNRSIGIGGDSVLAVTEGRVTAGPERKGPCMAEGGDVPALIDALNFLGTSNFGDTAKSNDGIKRLAASAKMKPELLAKQALEYAVAAIRSGIDSMLEEINSKPVYTIHEMLEGKKIAPQKIYIIGGPAHAVAKAMAGVSEITVPEYFEVANAIGAALARTTFQTELFSDTSKGIMTMPNLGIEKRVDRRYSVEDAKHDALEHTRKFMEKTGYDTSVRPELVEVSAFRMLSGYSSSGCDIRVKCQVKPGLIKNLHAKAKGGAK
jgi:N-methylhydantoinase A/oxoprolinase/acetone carboxylase beta subunit